MSTLSNDKLRYFEKAMESLFEIMFNDDEPIMAIIKSEGVADIIGFAFDSNEDSHSVIINIITQHSECRRVIKETRWYRTKSWVEIEKPWSSSNIITAFDVLPVDHPLAEKVMNVMRMWAL